MLDLWVAAWRKKLAKGERIAVRYADDAVLGFQYQEDAQRFLQQLQVRLGKFGLELHPERTRLIEFGRYAIERRAKRGEGKPETFNFLGFTHICGTSHKTGYFTVHRKTIGQTDGRQAEGDMPSCGSGCRESRGPRSGCSRW